jgi:hypothetical protein
VLLVESGLAWVSRPSIKAWPPADAMARSHTGNQPGSYQLVPSRCARQSVRRAPGYKVGGTPLVIKSRELPWLFRAEPAASWELFHKISSTGPSPTCSAYGRCDSVAPSQQDRCKQRKLRRRCCTADTLLASLSNESNSRLTTKPLGALPSRLTPALSDLLRKWRPVVIGPGAHHPVRRRGQRLFRETKVDQQP